MQRSKTPTHTEPPSLELHLIISNADPGQDTRLRFEFKRDATARLWLVRLRALRNYDVFPRQLTTDVWELRLEAIADTRPLEILNYTKDSARAWLRQAHPERPEAGATELLILADQRQFTVALREF